MNVRYKSEPGHNYVIVSEENEVVDIGYRCRMLEENRIEYFNELHIEYIDNAPEYYYDITSMQSLKDMYKGRKVTYEDVKHIVESVKMICMVCEEYLLKIDEILFEPEFIYINPTTLRIKFCYYPGNKHTLKEGIINLCRFFMDVVEHNDRKSVEYVYELYCECVKDDFVVDKWVNTGVGSNVSDVLEEAYDEESRDIMQENDNYSYEKNKKVGIVNGFGIHSNIIVIMVIVIMFIVMLPVIIITGFCADINWYGAVGLGVLCGVAASCAVCKYMISHKASSDKDAHNIPAEEYADNKNSNETNLDMYADGNAEYCEESQETVLMAFGSDERNYLLCKSTGMCYQVVVFPYFIGTMKEKNDLLPESDKVSRIHARIIKENDDIMLEDMNSKNGTFVNGSMLEPYEKRIIKNGDVIGFADVEYVMQSDI